MAVKVKIINSQAAPNFLFFFKKKTHFNEKSIKGAGKERGQKGALVMESSVSVCV